jgi:hypothetical protein
VIDVFYALARWNLVHIRDDLVIPQVGDDKIPLGVRI